MKSKIGRQPSNAKLAEWLKVLNNYSDNISEEDQEVVDIITEGVFGRSDYDEIYKDIEEALKGNVISPDMEKMFATNLGSNEPRLIMNNKAAAFDTSALNVQLAPKLKPTNAQDGLRTDGIITRFNKYINAYVSSPKYEFTFASAIKSSRAYPMSITLLGWDDDIVVGNHSETLVGDITTESIPIQNFWWDPAAISIEECDYAFISKLFSFRKLKQALSVYKGFNLEVLEAAYYSTGIRYRNNNMWVGNDNIQNTETQISYGSIPITIVFKKHYGETPKDNKVKVYYVIADEFVIASTEYKIPMLPFAILKEDEVPNVFTGVSSVMMSLPAIKKDYLYDSILTNLAIQKKTPGFLVSTGSGVNMQTLLSSAESTNVTGQFVNGPVDNIISLIPTAPIDGELLTLKQSASQDIDRLASSTDLINGVTNSSITGAAVRNKEEQATIKENTSITELKKYLVRFVTIMIEMMKSNMMRTSINKNKTIYLRSMNQEKNRGDDKYSYTEFNKSDLEHIVADVDIDVTLLRSSKKLQQQNDLMTLYQIGLQYPSSAPVVTIEEIIDVLNLPNKDKILARISEDAQNKELELATQLVTQVMAIQQENSPEIQGMEVNQLVEIVLKQLKQQTLPTEKGE